MRSGDIILVKNNRLLSRIIKWFTKSEYSHAGVLIDQWHMYDTNYNTRSKIRHIDYPKSKYDIYRLKPGIKFDNKQFKKFIHDHIDNRYDFGEIFKIVFRRNTKDDDGKYICSMLVREAFREQGIDLTPGVEIPTPEDLRRSNLLYKVKHEL